MDNQDIIYMYQQNEIQEALQNPIMEQVLTKLESHAPYINSNSGLMTNYRQGLLYNDDIQEESELNNCVNPNAIYSPYGASSLGNSGALENNQSNLFNYSSNLSNDLGNLNLNSPANNQMDRAPNPLVQPHLYSSPDFEVPSPGLESDFSHTESLAPLSPYSRDNSPFPRPESRASSSLFEVNPQSHQYSGTSSSPYYYQDTPVSSPMSVASTSSGVRTRDRNASSSSSISTYQRAPRKCLKEYSQAQKKDRVRGQNNDASKRYREKKIRMKNDLTGEVVELKTSNSSRKNTMETSAAVADALSQLFFD